MTQRPIAEALGITQPAVSQQLRFPAGLDDVHPEFLLAAAAPVLKALAAEQGYTRLAVFGSVARHEARRGSDIDLLVEAPEGTSSFGFVGFKRLVEQILGREVDLVSYGGHKRELDDDIRRERCLRWLVCRQVADCLSRPHRRHGRVPDRPGAGQGQHRHDQTTIGSVASFFVSRVDTEVDKRLGENHPLRPKVAVANARLAFSRYEGVFASDRWKALKSAGARPQRPLWASTSVKDPALPDTLYVTDLVAPGAGNTMPEKTPAGVPRPRTGHRRHSY